MHRLKCLALLLVGSTLIGEPCGAAFYGMPRLDTSRDELITFAPCVSPYRTH